jgi:hypothetical protein
LICLSALLGLGFQGSRLDLDIGFGLEALQIGPDFFLGD